LLVIEPAEVMEDDNLARGLLEELKRVLHLEAERREIRIVGRFGAVEQRLVKDLARVQARRGPPTDRPQPVWELAGIPESRQRAESNHKGLLRRVFSQVDIQQSASRDADRQAIVARVQ